MNTTKKEFWPCGEYTTYVKKGCRCVPCKAANARVQKNRNEKIRAQRQLSSELREEFTALLMMPLPKMTAKWPPYSLE